MTYVAPIVEGHGEQQAVPHLLQRIAAAEGRFASLRVNPPIRIKSGSFIKDDQYFRKHVALAAGKARQHPNGHVLILLDCEDDCAASLGPSLLGRAQEVADDVSILVALARREYETWLVAAANSLRGVEGLPADLIAPADPEARRDAKGWLGRQMPKGYDPVRHQLPLTLRFELQAARTVASFDRLFRKIQGMSVAV